jgi:hypothetical protein
MTTTATRRRSPLTLDAHRALGNQLSIARNDLLHMIVDLSNTYGSTAKSSRAADRAVKAIDQLRSDLDNQLAVDHPSGFDTHIYYPGAGDPERN